MEVTWPLKVLSIGKYAEIYATLDEWRCWIKLKLLMVRDRVFLIDEYAEIIGYFSCGKRCLSFRFDMVTIKNAVFGLKIY